MAQAARKIVDFAPPRAAEPAPASQPAFARVATLDDEAFGSPALELQARLGAAVQAGAPAKWSYRKTFGFLVLVNGAFWLSLGVLISRFFV